MATALENAVLALEGVSVGDAFGECFFSAPRECLRNRELPSPPWVWTDDTHMALSIVETLQAHGEIQQDTLAGAFARRFMAEPYRGYGKGAFALLSRIASGEDWRIAAPKLFGHGSYGNGAAMRAAPTGGFFSGDPSRAASEAQLSAAVTHAHPEGQAGAMAVAAAAALAAGGRLAGRALIQATLPYVPDGETRSRIATSLDIPAEGFDEAVRVLGTGWEVSAPDTVPFCLWCAAHCLDDFEEAMWRTVAGMGDRDTTCAIVGGIVALSSRQVPARWIARREPLPEGFERA
ncbi:MAG: ADP-ribosylglycohydrolase family protein [Burkholderiales bacterium]